MAIRTKDISEVDIDKIIFNLKRVDGLFKSTTHTINMMSTDTVVIPHTYSNKNNVFAQIADNDIIQRNAVQITIDDNSVKLETNVNAIFTLVLMGKITT